MEKEEESRGRENEGTHLTVFPKYLGFFGNLEDFSSKVKSKVMVPRRTVFRFVSSLPVPPAEKKFKIKHKIRN
jgi:hypothetical protein